MPQANYQLWLPQVASDKEVAETRTLNRKERQERKLNAIFGKNLAADGQLNERGFYTDAQNAGLDPDQVAAAMKWYGASKAADVSTAQANQTLRMYGHKPEAQGRAGAQVGEPEPTYEQPAAEAPKSGMSAFWDRLRSRPNPTKSSAAADASAVEAQPVKSVEVPAPPTPKTKDWMRTYLGMGAKTQGDATAPAAQQATQAPAAPASVPAPDATQSSAPQEVQVTGTAGQSRVGDIFELPASAMRDENAPTLRPGVDLRSARQKVEDSYQASSDRISGGGASAAPPDGDYSKVFSYASVVDGGNVQLKQGIDNALSKLGQPAGQAGIDNILRIADATVAAPVPQYTDGKIDPGKTMQVQAEYPAKIQAARQKAIQDLASGNTSAIGEMFTAAGQSLSQMQQRNEARTKNAEAGGRNALASNITAVGKEAGLEGQLDPTTFTSQEDMSKFGQQATAYAELRHQIATGKLTDAFDVLNFAKNYSVAEGLGEAEGTRNLVMLLGVDDPGTRAMIAASLGHDGGIVGTATATALSSVLKRVSPVALANLTNGMKFSKDWRTHTGSGQAPAMESYPAPASSATATAPAPTNTTDPEQKPTKEDAVRKALGGKKKATRSGKATKSNPLGLEGF